MVTGVETAGLVLAAFPLVLSVLQRYHEGLEPLKDWWRYRRNFLKFTGTVGTQQIIFLENVELLLGPLVSSNSEMSRLLNDPGGSAWRSPELAKRLQLRLPNSYDAYMNIIGELNNTLEKLKTELGIVDGKSPDIDNDSSADRKGRWDEHLRRIKFSFDKKKWKEIANELQDGNNTLATLLGLSDKLAPARAQRALNFQIP